MPMQKDVGERVAWICLLLAGGMLLPAPGCAGDASRQSLYQRLQSSDHDEVVAAVVEAGRRKDDRAVPYLVDLLDNDGADVRMFSIESLRNITGQDFAYSPYDDNLKRRASVEEWRKWLAERSAAGGKNVGGG
jgi:hypothetical protein